MEIAEVNLWTVDYDRVATTAGGNPGGGGRPQNETFAVEVVTDTGARGVAANRGGGAAACHLVDAYFRPLLVGADPLDTERLWEEMVGALPVARGGLTRMAVSGVDLALWDLRGKVAGRPVYDLLGGRARDALPCYVTYTGDDVAAVADEGFLGVKLSVGVGPADGRAGLARVEQQVAAARDAVGPDDEVMIDCFGGWDREFTVRAAERLRPYDLAFIEDPLPAGHAAARYRDVRHAVGPTQLAVGNLEFEEGAFRDLADGAADVLQPDVQWVGGLTAMRRIGATARAHGVPLIPHRGNVYTVHYALANTNTPYLEYMLGAAETVQPVRPAIDGEPLPEDGTLSVGEDPGFGVSLNRAVLAPFSGL